MITFSNNERIYLWGTGIEAERFYSLYQSQYMFIAVIDNNSCDRQFHGLSVYEPNYLHNKNGIIIVAAGNDHSYNEISNQLKNMGFAENVDFFRSDCIGRKIAVLYGNCHVEQIGKFLERNIHFSRLYKMYVYYVAEGYGKSRYPSDAILSICDLFVSQDIRKGNSMNVPSYEELRCKINNTAKCIIIPNLYGINLFFPQLKTIMGLEEIMNRHTGVGKTDLGRYSQTELDSIKAFFRANPLWRDSYIDENHEACDVNELVERIMNKDIYDKENIIKNFDRQIKKIEDRETKCTIKISDYIKQNYKRVCLFYDPTHPTNYIIKEKTRRILMELSIPIEEYGDTVPGIDYAQVFLYGCVAKALELHWSVDYINISNRTNLRGYPLTLKEWVSDYIKWCFG